MQLVNIRFDRVFDITQDVSKRSTYSTLFSFEHNGKRFFSVSIDGKPRIESGMNVLAALQGRDDWKSLIGWKDLDTGQIHLPKLSRYVIPILQVSPIFLACAVGFKSTGSYWLLVGIILLAGGVLALLNEMRQVWQARRALEQS